MSDFDGWDDDGDFFDETEGSELVEDSQPAPSKPHPPPPPPPQPAHTLHTASFSPVAGVAASASRPTGPTIGQPSTVSAGVVESDENQANGWGDADDLFFDDDEDDAVVPATQQLPVGTLPAAPASQHAQNPLTGYIVPRTTPKEPEIANDGWDDDDDLLLEESTHNHSVAAPAPSPSIGTSSNLPKPGPNVQKLQSASFASDGWGDDSVIFDEFDDEADIDDNPISAHHSSTVPVSEPPPQQDRWTSQLQQNLESYILSLPHLTSSMNAVLQAEYNTPEKASELCQYYAQRPALTQYTLEKELPRMEYVLTTNDQVVSDDKHVVSQQLVDSTAHSLLSRCANQSLLADILHVLTGPDGLIRPQFMAMAVADASRFRLDVPQQVVQAQAQLGLSLPLESGRWRIAELLVQIIFVPNPHQPFVEYKLQSLEPLVSPEDAEWYTNLSSAASILEMLHPEEEPPTTSQEDYRDVFLQSQSLLQNSAEGMQLAWREVESVTGLGRKLNQLPAFLPDDVVQAAETASVSPPKERPTSILGGLVRSGLSQLAKTVTLPDEDPELYQEWQHRQQEQPTRGPQLYHKNTPTKLATAGVDDNLGNQQAQVSRPPLVDGEPAKRPPPPSPVPTRPADRSSNGSDTGARDTGGTNASRVNPSVVPLVENAFGSTASGPAEVEYQYRPQPEGRAELESEEPLVQDGWEEEEADAFDFEDTGDEHGARDGATVDDQVQSEPVLSDQMPTLLLDELGVAKDFVYDPETDIMPTRKRYVHPRPGSRDLRVIANSM